MTSSRISSALAHELLGRGVTVVHPVAAFSRSGFPLDRWSVSDVGRDDRAHGSGGRYSDHPYPDALPAPPWIQAHGRPVGSEIAPTTKPQPDSTLVKAFARAWRWQRLLDDGAYGSVSEISDAENISKSYVSRILRLALLAPDIIEAILGGGANQSLMLQQLEGPLPVTWLEQRGMLVRSRRCSRK